MLRQCCERCSRLFRAWEVIQQQPAATSSRVESGNEWTPSRLEGPVAVVCEAPRPMSVTQARMVGQALGHKHLFHKTPTGKLHSHPYRNQPLITWSAIHHHHQPVTWEEGVPVAVWVWVWVYVPEHRFTSIWMFWGYSSVSFIFCAQHKFLVIQRIISRCVVVSFKMGSFFVLNTVFACVCHFVWVGHHLLQIIRCFISVCSPPPEFQK